jgi:hypothetical protein
MGLQAQQGGPGVEAVLWMTELVSWVSVLPGFFLYIVVGFEFRLRACVTFLWFIPREQIASYKCNPGTGTVELHLRGSAWPVPEHLPRRRLQAVEEFLPQYLSSAAASHPDGNGSGSGDAKLPSH